MGHAPAERAKILVVDDLPEKLLVYHTLLEGPGQEVIAAASGEEALKLLLRHDFAVILLDVNMPGMDGFETAGLIRGRKRCAHTPIIFVTAHTDELHALQGYSLGAVDFILAPVVPDILRTKVRVFVELFKLNQQVREQAATRVALAEREQAHLADLLDRTTDLIARVGSDGEVSAMNRCGRAMLGYEPAAAIPGNLSDLYPPDAATQMRERALPAAQRDGVWFGEARLLSRDGREIPVSQVVRAHQAPDGELEHFSIVARDISRRLAAEAALADSEQRYREVVHALPAATYTCDNQGRITLYNAMAATLWGREPKLGEDLWCGSWKIYSADGTPMGVDECPMAVAIREGRAIRGEEIIIERPDGSRRNVMPYPQPIRDSGGRVVATVNMLVDITDRKMAERALHQSEERLRVMFGQAAVGITLLNRTGGFLEANDRMCQIVGRTSEELLSCTCESLTFAEDWPAHQTLMAELIAGLRDKLTVEKRYERGDGSLVWVNVSMSALTDERGVPQRIVSIVEDIGPRKQAEDELRRHREHLEQLVQERTAALEASHERLRFTDRLASVGTLAAGLGHDMGNLLLPVRMRLDALERMELPAEAREDVAAIADACEYLKRLTHGLRLFALNPDDERAAGDHTIMAAWWADVSTFMRNALSRTIELTSHMGVELPPVMIAPQLLTQSVYNLIQNAGDAMKESGGSVEVRATVSGDGKSIILSIIDTGPGMTAEVLRRCTEPFFTTKTRGISTGLGLALVHGAVRKVGGHFEIRSEIGRGTTCQLTLPVYIPVRQRSAVATERIRACVELNEPRMRAFVDSILQSLNVAVVTGSENGAKLLISDNVQQNSRRIQDFLAADPSHRAVLFGDAAGLRGGSDQAFPLDARPSAVRLRTVLRSIVDSSEPCVQEVAT